MIFILQIIQAFIKWSGCRGTDNITTKSATYRKGWIRHSKKFTASNCRRNIHTTIRCLLINSRSIINLISRRRVRSLLCYLNFFYKLWRMNSTLNMFKIRIMMNMLNRLRCRCRFPKFIHSHFILLITYLNIIRRWKSLMLLILASKRLQPIFKIITWILHLLHHLKIIIIIPHPCCQLYSISIWQSINSLNLRSFRPLKMHQVRSPLDLQILSFSISKCVILHIIKIIHHLQSRCRRLQLLLTISSIVLHLDR